MACAIVFYTPLLKTFCFPGNNSDGQKKMIRNLILLEEWKLQVDHIVIFFWQTLLWGHAIVFHANFGILETNFWGHLGPEKLYVHNTYGIYVSYSVSWILAKCLNIFV